MKCDNVRVGLDVGREERLLYRRSSCYYIMCATHTHTSHREVAANTYS